MPRLPRKAKRQPKPGEVADPVHKYIRFTSIEREIINHRVTQRLRHIAQTGLAQFVYPELRTSRFSHSLGAMHLTSGFLASSLRNACPEIRAELLQLLDEMIREVAGEYGGVEQAIAGLEGEPLELSEDIAEIVVDPDGTERLVTCPAIRVIEQALRLAALFHDLGHLPFSHDFETALEEYGRKHKEEMMLGKTTIPPELFEQDIPTAGKLHEQLGRRLSELILNEIAPSFPAEKRDAIRCVFKFAQKIFDSTYLPSPKPDQAAIYWLHNLIDGELDVDRCDYVLRDGRNYSFAFAAVDLARLVGNLVVHKRENAYVVAILPHGISAVEDFLTARYRSYQHGVRHHKVSQIGVALQHCIVTILEDPQTTPWFDEFLSDLKLLAAATASKAGREAFKELVDDQGKRKAYLERFSRYDDNWFTLALRQYKTRNEWFELVCYRAAGPTTLWKWIGDFPRAEEIASWNSRLPKKKEEEAYSEWYAETLRLNAKGVLIIRHKFMPWEPDIKIAVEPLTTDPDNDHLEEDVMQEIDGDRYATQDEIPHSKLCVLKKGRNSKLELEPITKLSSLVRSLWTAWPEELQVHCFASTEYMNGREVTEVAKEVCLRLEQTMKDGSAGSTTAKNHLEAGKEVN